MKSLLVCSAATMIGILAGLVIGMGGIGKIKRSAGPGYRLMTGVFLCASVGAALLTKRYVIGARWLLLLIPAENVLFGWILSRYRKSRQILLEQTVVKNGSIEFYRFLFMTILFLYHGAIVWGTTRNNGYLCTEFFFLTSGWFLMAHFIKEEARGSHSPGRYALERLRRIMPCFLMVWLMSLVYNMICFRSSPVQVLQEDIPYLLLLQTTGFFGVGILNMGGVDWYISAMFWASLVVYGALCLNRRIFVRWVAPVLSVSAILWLLIKIGTLNVTVLHPGPFGLMTDGFWRGLAEMGLGCVLYSATDSFRQKKERTERFRMTASVMETVATILLLLIMTREEGSLAPAVSGFSLILMILTVVSLMSSRSCLSEFFNKPVWILLGRLTMPFYLFHVFALRLVKDCLPQMTMRDGILTAAVFSLAVSVLLVRLTGYLDRLMRKKRPDREMKVS